MEVKEMIFIASKAIRKGWSFDELAGSDDMSGRENYVDDVWEYVIEHKEQGEDWFYEAYHNFKLY